MSLWALCGLPFHVQLLLFQKQQQLAFVLLLIAQGPGRAALSTTQMGADTGEPPLTVALFTAPRVQQSTHLCRYRYHSGLQTAVMSRPPPSSPWFPAGCSWHHSFLTNCLGASVPEGTTCWCLTLYSFSAVIPAFSFVSLLV